MKLTITCRLRHSAVDSQWGTAAGAWLKSLPTERTKYPDMLVYAVVST